jgi:uncharacterized protein YuzE
MKISYDKQADILHVWFSLVDPPYINVENENGDVVRIKEQDGTIVGLIIFDAMYRMKTNKVIDIPQVGEAPISEITLALMSIARTVHANA